MVSLDTGHLEDVIRGIHRLLDLVHKYEDVEVLTLLLRAVLQDLPLAGAGTAHRWVKEILGARHFLWYTSYLLFHVENCGLCLPRRGK